MIELRNINRVYKSKKTVHALKDINLQFKSGEFIAILGLTGSGKTTLLSIIGGMDKPSSGQYIFQGEDTSKFSHRNWSSFRKDAIGFVFQDFHLIEHLTAEENIMLSLSLSNLSEENKRSRVKTLLEEVEMLEYAHHLPNELSGGQQQRIAIARALANEPNVILADEPTGALDPKTSIQILMLLDKLSKNGHLVIMVTHNHKLAEKYASRVIEIEDGKVVQDSDPHESCPLIVKRFDKKNKLEMKTSLQIAYNNLKLRKKSTFLILMALIPCMILTMFLTNFYLNLKTIREDINPLYESIIEHEHIAYFSPLSDYDFTVRVRKTINELNHEIYNRGRLDLIEEILFNPMSDETRETILNLKEVDAIYEPIYLDVKIGAKIYLLVSLPSKEHKNIQYDFHDYYPNNDDDGIIISTILSEELDLIEGQSLELGLTAINGVSLHGKTLLYNNEIQTQIIKVNDFNAKTSLMQQYHTGVIYGTYNYVKSLKDRYTSADISLVSFDIATYSEKTQYKVLGGKALSDLQRYYKEPNIFGMLTHAFETPNEAFGIKQTLILNAPLSEASIEIIDNMGWVTNTKYHQDSIKAAKRMNKNITLYLSSTKWIIAIIVSIPILILSIILFISILIRKDEIGVMKAIGIKKEDIIKTFFFESSIISISSALVSLIIAIPMMYLTCTFLERKTSISTMIGANPFAVSLPIISMAVLSLTMLVSFTGILPGIKASRLEAKRLLNSID